ncbi:MAG: hypothetical protein JSS81_17080 [Acidobacteria bacterium]|nr:hypothetical protein [Acidobacteriota bacterium]
MQTSSSTVILLMNRMSESETQGVRQWFEASRFEAREAFDIFQAIEEISDFTNSHRPDVILLAVESMTEDFPLISRIAGLASDVTTIPLMVLSKSTNEVGNNDYLVGSLRQMAAKLDQIFPDSLNFRAAA